MSAQDNGGPAFPKAHNSNYQEERGMTLRDYFAAKAMQGIIGSSKLKDGFSRDDIASDAYDMADAMLEARKK